MPICPLFLSHHEAEGYASERSGRVQAGSIRERQASSLPEAVQGRGSEVQVLLASDDVETDGYIGISGLFLGLGSVSLMP